MKTCGWIPEKIVIGIHPGSVWATKRWPLDFFGALADRLIHELDCHVVLMGSPEDRGYAGSFSVQKPERVLNLIGKTTLPDLVSAVDRLDVLVSGDTAPLHVAGAREKKIVALFGPTDPKRHMQSSEDATILTKHLACQPCYQGICRNEETLACLKNISVNEVFDAVCKRLEVSVLR